MDTCVDVFTIDKTIDYVLIYILLYTMRIQRLEGFEIVSQETKDTPYTMHTYLSILHDYMLFVTMSKPE